MAQGHFLRAAAYGIFCDISRDHNFEPRDKVKKDVQLAIAKAKIKTGEINAEVLVQLLRCDCLPDVWQPDEGIKVYRAWPRIALA